MDEFQEHMTLLRSMTARRQPAASLPRTPFAYWKTPVGTDTHSRSHRDTASPLYYSRCSCAICQAPSEKAPSEKAGQCRGQWSITKTAYTAPGLEAAQPFIVLCSLDEKVEARHYLERGLKDPNREFYHGDKRVSIFGDTGAISPPAGYEAPKFDVPTVHVSTADGYSPCVDEIANRIRASMLNN